MSPAKYPTIPTVAANYLLSLGTLALLRALPPEAAFHLDIPSCYFFLVVIAISIIILARVNWKAACVASVLLLPLAGFQWMHITFSPPAQIAERINLPDGSSTLYSLLQQGFPDNSQIVCIQRSLFSGCEVIDSWQTQYPCEAVLPKYLDAYTGINRPSVGEGSSPGRDHRQKCG
jgi:hypothetical protein